MTLIWIVLGFAAWMLGFLFLMVLMRMASAEDCAALQQEKLLEPLSSAIVTRAGVGQFACIDRGTELVVDAADKWVSWRQEWHRAA